MSWNSHRRCASRSGSDCCFLTGASLIIALSRSPEESGLHCCPLHVIFHHTRAAARSLCCCIACLVFSVAQRQGTRSSLCCLRPVALPPLNTFDEVARKVHSTRSTYFLYSTRSLLAAMQSLTGRAASARPLTGFVRIFDLKLGSEIITYFAILNKVAGVYGLLAVFFGGNLAQLSLYLYSVATLLACAWGLRQIGEVSRCGFILSLL